MPKRSLSHICMTYPAALVWQVATDLDCLKQVTDMDDRCRIDENIEIDAELKTPIFRAWVRFIHQKRHHPRLKIQKNLSPKAAVTL